MPYQGSAGNAGTAGSDSGGSVGTVAMPAQAPPDLGTGAGGLMQIGTTQVAGSSGTPGASLPVDAIEQASSMIAQGKADLGQTAGAENRLDGFDGVGGGGGGGANGANAQAAAGTATEAVGGGKGLGNMPTGGGPQHLTTPPPGGGGQPAPAPPAPPPPPTILT